MMPPAPRFLARPPHAARSGPEEEASMAPRLELGAAGQQRMTQEEEEDMEEREAAPHHCLIGEEAAGVSSAAPRHGALPRLPRSAAGRGLQ
jgi:hypothetical protein